MKGIKTTRRITEKANLYLNPIIDMIYTDYVVLPSNYPSIRRYYSQIYLYQTQIMNNLYSALFVLDGTPFIAFLNPGLSDYLIHRIEEKRKCDFVRLIIPGNIEQVKNCRISEDGKDLMFFGKVRDICYLFVINLRIGSIKKMKIGKGNIELLQGSWIYRNDYTIIKNEADYTYLAK